jgi:hypothetical protein
MGIVDSLVIYKFSFSSTILYSRLILRAEILGSTIAEFCCSLWWEVMVAEVDFERG